jgi:uncharacterized protein (TIGR02594 family)
MTKRYSIQLLSSDGEVAQLYEEPDPKSASIQLAVGFLVIKPHQAENEDWVMVDNYVNVHHYPNSGWVPSWAVGNPIADSPQELSAQSLTMAAARNEVEMSAQKKQLVSSEYLIALFLIENDLISQNITIDSETNLLVKDNRSTSDAAGAYAITSAEWEAFLVAEGNALGWSGNFTRFLPLVQMRCVSYLTRKDWRDFSFASGGNPTNPFIPRKIDLLISRLIGVGAAIDIAKREASKTGLGTKMTKVIRSANGWVANSHQEKTLFDLRAQFLRDNSDSVDVKTFLQRCRSALDPALSLAQEMLFHYLPGFVVTPAAQSAAWMTNANKELDQWATGNWTEHKDPGQARALSYFGATDHGDGTITDASTGEITDWCGAFVAHCIKAAGGSVPSGAASAANWQNWGDVSLPTTHDSNVPPGSVVVLAGNKDTSRIGHVCFFQKWSQQNKKQVICLGGNQSDKVSSIPLEVERIVAIRNIASKTTSSNDDEIILAKTLYGEIRGGDDAQIRNVANVVLNRFLTGYRSGGSIAGTCLSPKQFSCWNLGTQARSELDQLPNQGNSVLDSLVVVARDVIETRLTQGLTNNLPLQGARHYHNLKVSPDWADTSKLVMFNNQDNDGKHKFYRDIP